MSTLITGGAGFCGINIAHELLSRGDTVVLFGLESVAGAALEALNSLPGRLHQCIGDVRDSAALSSTLTQYKIEYIVHGAAITAALEREKTQAATIMDVNIGGTIQVLEAAIRHNIKRVVQLSSGAVYGASVKQEGWLDPDLDAPVPDSLYGISKMASERIGLRYRATRNVDIVVLRLGVVFGRWEYDTGMRDTLSIPLNLSLLAESGGEARFLSSLPNDWVYATDVAQGVRKLLDAPQCQRGLYQVATGKKWSAVDWCQRLQSIYPKFQYQVVTSIDQANVGVPAPTPRPPFTIKHLINEHHYQPRYLEEDAFNDYIAWRELVA